MWLILTEMWSSLIVDENTIHFLPFYFVCLFEGDWPNMCALVCLLPATSSPQESAHTSRLQCTLYIQLQFARHLTLQCNLKKPFWCNTVRALDYITFTHWIFRHIKFVRTYQHLVVWNEHHFCDTTQSAFGDCDLHSNSMLNCVCIEQTGDCLPLIWFLSPPNNVIHKHTYIPGKSSNWV